jgi:hypothetical protein
VVHETASREQIERLKAIAARNLADASVVGLSPDGRFEHAYGAARTLATIIVRTCGYRVRQPAAHFNTFQALNTADSGAFGRYAAYFDSCRGLRNSLTYDEIDVISEGERDDLLEELTKFEQAVWSWVEVHHPEFLRKR